MSSNNYNTIFSFSPTLAECNANPPSVVAVRGLGNAIAPVINLNSNIQLQTSTRSNQECYVMWQGMLGPRFTASWEALISGSADWYGFSWARDSVPSGQEAQETIATSTGMKTTFNFFSEYAVRGLGMTSNAWPTSSNQYRFNDGAWRSYTLDYNWGMVTITFNGVRVFRNYIDEVTVLRNSHHSLCSNSYFGFHSVSGGLTHSCFLRNITIRGYPAWSSNRIWAPYDVTYLPSTKRAYTLMAPFWPTDSNSIAPSNILATNGAFRGGWVKTFPRGDDRTGLVDNELFRRADLGMFLVQKTAESGGGANYYGTWSNQTVYNQGDIIFSNGSGYMLASNATPSNVPPPGNGFEYSTPTTPTSWLPIWKPTTHEYTPFLANIYLIHNGTVYRAAQNAVQSGSNIEVTVTDTSLFTAQGWASLPHPQNALLRSLQDSNILYIAASATSNAPVGPNSNYGQGWVRLHKSVQSNIPNLDHSSNETVYVPGLSNYYYALTGSNIAGAGNTTVAAVNSSGEGWVPQWRSTDANSIATFSFSNNRKVFYAQSAPGATPPAASNTTGTGWVEVLSTDAGQIGHYIWNSTLKSARHGTRGFLSATTPRFVNTYFASSNYTSNTEVGYQSQGYATLTPQTAGTTPVQQRSNLNAWLPMWNLTSNVPYYATDLIFHGGKTFGAITAPSNGDVPSQYNSNNAGWAPLLITQNAPFFQNTYAYSHCNQAAFRAKNTMDLTAQDPLTDLTESYWQMTTVPRTGAISLARTRGQTIAKQQDTFTWSPLTLPGTQRWFETTSNATAAGGNLASWTDQSGNNIGVTPTNGPGFDPIGSNAVFPKVPVVTFRNTGSSQQILTFDAGSANSSYTVGFNCYMNYKAGWQYIFDNSAFALMANNRVLLMSIYGSNTYFAYNYVDNDPMVVVISGGTNGTVGAHTVYVNGTLLGTGCNLQATNILSTVGMGSKIPVPESFAGGVAEIVLVNSALSTTDRQKLEGYLAWNNRYTGSQLAAGHPYRSVSPVVTASG